MEIETDGVIMTEELAYLFEHVNAYANSYYKNRFAS